MEIKTFTTDELVAILAAHAKWLRNEAGGVQANLRYADLRYANLRYANLQYANMRYANLQFANLRSAEMGEATVLTYGESWLTYLNEVVPSLLCAGGKPLADVATKEHWECHDWNNCPMAAAFGVKSQDETPKLLRPRVDEFVQLFDAGLIPMPSAK